MLAPFNGYSDVIELSIEDIMSVLDLDILFRSRWKMGRGGEAMLEELLKDDRILKAMKPKAVYGYFPVYRDDHRLIVNDSIEWEFPEIKGKTLADHFKRKEDGGDMIPLTTVTIGDEAVRLSKDMYANNDYAEYFLLYGLAAECTETLASIINAAID